MHLYARHAHIVESRHTHEHRWLVLIARSTHCDVTHSWVWHDSHSRCQVLLTYPILNRPFCALWHVSFIYVRRLVLWRDAFVCATWLIHTYMCDMTRSWVQCDSFICVTWFIHGCKMIHSRARRNHSRVLRASFICVTWLIYACDMTHPVTWLIHTFDATHSYVWRDSFICVTWLIHVRDMIRTYDVQHCWRSLHRQFHALCVCGMTDSCAWYDSFMYVTWRIHVRDMTHSCVGSDAFMCVTWRISTNMK